MGIAILVFVGFFVVYFVVVLVQENQRVQKEEKRKEEKRTRLEAQKIQKEKEYKEKHPHYKAENFYKSCKEAGITGAQSSEEKARLMLYVKNQSLQFTEKEAIDFYLLGKSEVEKFLEEERKAKEIADFERLKRKERIQETDATRYIKLFDQGKMQTMCLSNAKVYEQQLKTLKRAAEKIIDSSVNAYNTFKQRESDWATAGGIASGIAGGAAGISVAMDIQMKNAEIRLQNAQLKSSINSLTGLSYQQNIQKQCEVEEQLNFWKDLANKASELLVQKMPNVNLVKKISPIVLEQTQSKTNAVTLKVQIQPAQDLKIYDTVDAVVDGSFKAVLWDGNSRVGEAYFVLPYNGATSSTTLEGICRSEFLKPNTTYNVTFEENHLWGIEKIKNN